MYVCVVIVALSLSFFRVSTERVPLLITDGQGLQWTETQKDSLSRGKSKKEGPKEQAEQ
jgi:hypothetical protein